MPSKLLRNTVYWSSVRGQLSKAIALLESLDKTTWDNGHIRMTENTMRNLRSIIKRLDKERSL